MTRTPGRGWVGIENLSKLRQGRRGVGQRGVCDWPGLHFELKHRNYLTALSDVSAPAINLSGAYCSFDRHYANFIVIVALFDRSAPGKDFLCLLVLVARNVDSALPGPDGLVARDGRR